MSQRAEQFLQYLKEHNFKFNMQKVLEETSMNRNIFYKVIGELKPTHTFTRTKEGYTVEKKEGGSMDVVLNDFFTTFLEQIKNKGDAGITIAETGLSIPTFRSRIIVLRNKGYRIDFQNDHYSYKGMGDFSLSLKKGETVPRKILARKPSESKPRKVPVTTPITPVPTLFTINQDVLDESLKGAPKEYSAFVKDVLKRVSLANNAYATLACAKVQMNNLQGILQKVGE